MKVLLKGSIWFDWKIEEWKESKKSSCQTIFVCRIFSSDSLSPMQQQSLHWCNFNEKNFSCSLLSSVVVFLIRCNKLQKSISHSIRLCFHSTFSLLIVVAAAFCWRARSRRDEKAEEQKTFDSIDTISFSTWRCVCVALRVQHLYEWEIFLFSHLWDFYDNFYATVGCTAQTVLELGRTKMFFHSPRRVLSAGRARHEHENRRIKFFIKLLLLVIGVEASWMVTRWRRTWCKSWFSTVIDFRWKVEAWHTQSIVKWRKKSVESHKVGKLENYNNQSTIAGSGRMMNCETQSNWTSNGRRKRNRKALKCWLVKWFIVSSAPPRVIQSFA